jgi:hypothetical protein
MIPDPWYLVPDHLEIHLFAYLLADAGIPLFFFLIARVGFDRYSGVCTVLGLQIQ